MAGKWSEKSIRHFSGNIIYKSPLKNMKVNGKDYPIYYHILWKITNV
jgi:hypothetical protein